MILSYYPLTVERKYKMGKLDEILQDYFKCKTRTVENPVIATAPVAAAVCLRNSPDRLAWAIINLGANPIYLALTNAVGVANGILLTPLGGHVSMFWQEDFQMVGWAWWCSAPAGATNMYVLEVIGS